MNDVPFHLTVMGRDFYEPTMPALVRELERLNGNLGRVVPAIVMQARTGPVAPASGRADMGSGPAG